MEEITNTQKTFTNIQKNDDLRVLMLGGRRCGKTSVLASMFHSIVTGATNSFLTIADDTKLENKGAEMQDSLIGKTAELKDLLDKGGSSTFLVDQGPSKYWWDYRLKIKIPGTNREMFINFRDVPGEFCRQGNEHEGEVKEYVKQCDVFVVVVDTPYLMESANPQNKLCSDGHNDVVNRIQDIQQYLTCIDDSQGQNGKMVIFCPVKCEKWYKAGHIDMVNDRLLQVYDACITNLKAYNKMDISIIPILTAGNIDFVEQKEALVLSKKNGFSRSKRCCRLSPNLLRLSDGTTYRLADGDIVNEDNEAIIFGTKLVRPYSWFRIRYNDDSSLNGFKPLNCEQIPLHIIRFMLKKFDYEESHPTVIWARIKIWFQKVFGMINPGELKNIIIAMQHQGIVKDSVEYGIVHIKQAY